MQIFVINLDSSPDRLAAVTASLRDAGLGFERVPAVDGRRLSDLERSTFLAARPGCRLQPGEIGCFLSHQRIWEMVVQRGGWATVLEDDAVASRKLGAFLDQFPASTPGALIKIETVPYVVEIGRPIAAIAEVRLHRLRSAHIGTAGYLIDPGSARFLLDATARLTEPIDAIFRKPFIAMRGLRVLQAIPAMVKQGGGFSSDIGSARRAKPPRTRGAVREVVRSIERQLRKVGKAVGRVALGRRRIVVPLAE